ncbi:MAG: transcriptional repressor [Clostridia bacterium]|nr:transcriptional repressor [Clostridia bacterium]
MAEYITEQKRTLKKILEDNCDRAYTVDELFCKMQALYPSKAPGKSTVYRLITHLVNEGAVKRFIKDGERKAAYQIVMGEHCDCHLHLKCTDCGKLIHLNDKISDELLSTVQSTSDFSVNEEATVLFGTCGSCKKHSER